MLDRRSWRLSEAERRAWHDDGFFMREAVFDADEVAGALRRRPSAASRARPPRSTSSSASYAIDGNVYHEAGGSTIQLEHAPGSQTIRVIEPFHHLDERMDRLLDDPRIVEPMRDLIGDERVALFTDKLNLKRPREGSRFRWHQDSPYWAHFFRELDRLPNVLRHARRRRRAQRLLPRDPRQPSPRHAAGLRGGRAARPAVHRSARVRRSRPGAGRRAGRQPGVLQSRTRCTARSRTAPTRAAARSC